MKYRDFIVVAKGGHETMSVKAPRPVTLDYARKVAYHWAEVVDCEDEETETLVYRRMRHDECAFVCPAVDGMVIDPRKDIPCRSYMSLNLLRMGVLASIERGENTLEKKMAHDPHTRQLSDLYRQAWERLENEGYIVKTADGGYKFN